MPTMNVRIAGINFQLVKNFTEKIVKILEKNMSVCSPIKK